MPTNEKSRFTRKWFSVELCDEMGGAEKNGRRIWWPNNGKKLGSKQKKKKTSRAIKKYSKRWN